MKTIFRLTIAFVSCISLWNIRICPAQTTVIAGQGKSTFTIILPADSPLSVQEAARELQQDIELATGARLPLQRDDEKIPPPYISLGNTHQAQAADITAQGIAEDGFHIVTKADNLYILGPDTPDRNGKPKIGSHGTANGVYSFLEEYLNVRWLMPGELGRDVPVKSTFTLGEIDQIVVPKFKSRRLTHLYDYFNTQQVHTELRWEARQKLERGTPISYDHNWTQTVKPEIFNEHPDWFAMRNGKRVPPTGHRYKLETTNPELVRYFAEQAIQKLKANGGRGMFSLSPSDGGGWSQSPESRALYDPSPTTFFDPEAPPGQPGMSSLVLKWYHDVAQIVAKEYPEARLGGYIYADYIYPPTKFQMKLPDNFVPMIAPSRDYGYGLYRDETQEYFKSIMDAWAKVTPPDWYYYDLPNQILRSGAGHPGNTGLVTPPASDILNIIFPQLLKSHITGVHIYGTTSWSNAALTNYMLAKLMWNPHLDARDVQREWLHRAYGAQAGTAMEALYVKLNGWFREHYRKHETDNYTLTRTMLAEIYSAPRYAELEKLLLNAKAQPMTDVQKQRLQLIEDNLIVLQWRLRNAGLLPVNFASALQRGNAEVIALLKKTSDGFPLFPGVLPGGNYPPAKLPRWKVQFTAAPPVAQQESTSPPLNANTFLLYAAQDGEVRITPQKVMPGPHFADYLIRNSSGKWVTSGIFDEDTPITFQGKAGTAYYFSVPLNKAINYTLTVENAALAQGDFADGTLMLSGSPGALYVYYQPGRAPLGVFDEKGSVTIQKPFSGAEAKASWEKIGYSDIRVLSLDEGWRFQPDPQNDGLQRGVLNADFDDSSWKLVSALDWWQNQGFPNYHGTAWYRIKFEALKPPRGYSARLFFGGVDGNATVYLNGHKATEHKLGENFEGWNQPFSKSILGSLQSGENTLVVQVISKNQTTASGIFKGVSLLTGKSQPQ